MGDLEINKHSILADPETFTLKGVEMTLVRSDLVFGPSPHGLFLGEHISVDRGDTFIDVGCGSGLYAIMASKIGAKASATEITKEAVEMTRYNALLNNVHVDVRLGSYFADFSGVFNVIVANLPQKIILKSPDGKKKHSLSETDFYGTHGGPLGNEILLSFFDRAVEHMDKTSRLYIQIYSLTDYKGTLSRLEKNFSARELAKRDFIEDDIISVNEDEYIRLKNEGVIDISNRDGHWYTYETAYELMLK